MIIEVDDEELRTIIEEVAALAEQRSENFRLVHNEIRISDRGGLERLGGTWRAFHDEGFGYSISNHNHGNEWYRLIVLNAEALNEIQLTREEKKCVILHELGHLLNQPIISWEPSILDCRRYNIHINEKNDIVQSNKKRKEVHADAFAKQFGFVEESISLFEKHNQRTGSHVGFLKERIEALNDENPRLDGFIVEVNTNF